MIKTRNNQAQYDELGLLTVLQKQMQKLTYFKNFTHCESMDANQRKTNMS